MTWMPEVNRPERLGAHYPWWDVNATAPEYYASYVPYRFKSGGFFSRTNRYVNGAYRSGGDFISSKTIERSFPSSGLTVYRPGGGVAYVGRFTSNENGWHWPPYDWDSHWRHLDQMERLRNRSAEAWNLMRPDLPDFSMANELFELRDVPGLLKDSTKSILQMIGKARAGKRSYLSRSGEYYLALNFGWLPILRSIQGFVETQRNQQKILSQLIRNAGRPVRRSTVNKQGKDRLKDDFGDGQTQSGTDVYPWTYGNLNPILVSQCYSAALGGAARRWTIKTESRTWAEGQFRYVLPPGPHDVVWTKQMLRRIYGFRITPSMVYNAMPWSWLMDYFSSLGDFIQAVSPGVADNLICDYMFIMQRQAWKSNVENETAYNGNMEGTSYLKAVAHYEAETVNKYRVGTVYPFGFGFKRHNLNAKQLSILAALGLSRLP